MRSTRMNGASKNRDSCRYSASKLFSIGSFCMFLFLSVSFCFFLYVYLRHVYLRHVYLGNFLTEIFHQKFFDGNFFAGNILPNLLIFFGRIFLTYNLLTIASFRIGVPSILLLIEKLEIEKTKTT